MQRVRNSNVDNINIFTPDYTFPIGRGLSPAPLHRKRLQFGLFPSTYPLQVQRIRNLKEVPDLMEGIRVRARDRSASDHRDVQLFCGIRHWRKKKLIA